MSKRTLVAIAALVIGAPLAARTSNAFTNLELTVSGSHFKINGTTTFLAVASYFDAIHGNLSIIGTDFGLLKGDGFNGVRILPNWFRMTGNYDTTTHYLAQDTLFDKDGHLRSATLNKLLDILDAAKDHGLIVDLTFTAETVVDCPADNCTSGTSALSFAEYKSALQAITTQLANGGSAYKHVMFDLQNEVDKTSNGPYDRDMDADDIDELAEAVHAIDPGRIVFASLQSTVSPSTAATFANNAETDVAPLHERRVINWGNDSDLRVDQMQVVTGLPIYLQESPRYRSGGGSEDTSCWFDSDQAAKSLYEAKRSGAAAWNFHTRAGMTLNGTFSGYSFYDNLVAGDKEEDFVTADLAATLSCSGSGCPTADLHATCSAPEPDTMAGRVNRTPLGWLRHHMRDGAHPLHPERD